MSLDIPVELSRFEVPGESMTLRFPSQRVQGQVFVVGVVAIVLYFLEGYRIYITVSGADVSVAFTLLSAPLVVGFATVAAVSCAFSVWGYEEIRIARDGVSRIRGLGGWRVERRLPRPTAWSFHHRRAYILDNGLPSQVGPWLDFRAGDGSASMPVSFRIGQGLKLDPSTLEAVRVVLEAWARP